MIFRSPDFKEEENGKTTITTMLKFFWKQGDVIGVVPADAKSLQANFTVRSAGTEASTSKFDGGSWSLKEGQEYLSYFPFAPETVTSVSSIPFSFEGQIQKGNNNTAHLGDYDLMYAASTLSSDGQCLFSFSHKCAVLRFQLHGPAGKAFSSITIASDSGFPDCATLKLSDGSLSLNTGTKAFHVGLEDAVSDSEGNLFVWVMVPPCDMSAAKFVVTAQAADGSLYSTDMASMKNHKAGKAYNYSLALTDNDFGMYISGETAFLRPLWDYYIVTTTRQVPFEVAVNSSKNVMSADVSPHSKKIVPSIQSDGVHFTVKEYGRYIVSVNGTKICLFADEAEIVPDGVDIKSLQGTDATGKTEMTSVMQQAINSTASSGQTLVLSEGKYLCRQLSFPSNADLYITKDAELLIDASSRDYYKYGSYWTFLHAENANNVRIRGLGVIDGRCRDFWPAYGENTKVKMLIFRNCTNLLFEGVQFKDSPRWNLHLFECSDVVCRRLKVYDNISILGNDGIDPDCSQRVTIEDCFIMTGDDCVPVKTHYIAGWTADVRPKATKDVLVQNCVVLTGGASALKTGLDVQNDSEGIRFLNNDVIDAGLWPIDISALAAGDIKAGNLKSVYYENNRIQACQRYLRIRLNAGLSDCHINDCTYETTSRDLQASTAHGDSSFPAECSVEDLYIAGQKITSSAAWGLDVRDVKMSYK